MITAKNILSNYLAKNGYDGLVNPGECGCDKTDLIPCDGCTQDCQPAYKWWCKRCKIVDCDMQTINGGHCFNVKEQE